MPVSSEDWLNDKIEKEKENIVRISLEMDKRLRAILIDMLHQIIDLYVITGRMKPYRERQFRTIEEKIFELFGEFDYEEE